METNKKHKVTDLSYLKRLSNGDDNFVREMIVTFIEQTPQAIDNLEKYTAEKNWKMVRAVAHKMKPSLLFIGMNDLQDTINAVEENAENETNLDQLPGLVARVKESCNNAVRELEEDIQATK